MTAPARVAPEPRASWGSAATWVRLLCVVLAGYAILGRGWAYIGLPPLYVGEILLLSGLLWTATRADCRRLAATSALLPLAALMTWGALRTLPFVPAFGVDALRDSVVWSYGLLAFVVLAVISTDARAVPQLLNSFRRFAILFVLWFPTLWALQLFADAQMPRWPWNDRRIIELKAGDAMVHLAGITAFWALGLHRGAAAQLGRGSVVFSFMTLMVTIAVIAAFNRGAMLAFAAATGICLILRPRTRLLWTMAAAVVLLAATLWVTGLKLELGQRQRSISFDQLVANVSSVFTSTSAGDLDETKEWRMQWWSDIAHYTIRGPHFWVGKGFGVNLASDDGYQVEEDESLRSPHNVHLTFLARGGVPGLVLWVGVLAAWVIPVTRALLRARSRGDTHTEKLFIFLLAYFAAFIVNASFDVFLESPMGGIWFWTLYGIGLAVATQPHSLPSACAICHPPDSRTNRSPE